MSEQQYQNLVRWIQALGRKHSETLPVSSCWPATAPIMPLLCQAVPDTRMRLFESDFVFSDSIRLKNEEPKRRREGGLDIWPCASPWIGVHEWRMAQDASYEGRKLTRESSLLSPCVLLSLLFFACFCLEHPLTS